MRRIKNIIKLIFCKIVYRLGLLDLYIKYIFLHRDKFPAVIITYHRFVTDSSDTLECCSTVTHLIDVFEHEIRYLRRHYKIVSLDELVNTLASGEKFNQPTIAITIDDGFKDNYQLLFPLLKKYNIPVTIFITTAPIGTEKRLWVNWLEEIILNTSKTSFSAGWFYSGKTFSLNDIAQKREFYQLLLGKLKDIETWKRDQYLEYIEKVLGRPNVKKPIMLNWDEIREMQRAGVAFGAHTVNHPILTNLPLDEAKEEIINSKKKIERELGVTVNHFAYPNGRPQDFNDELREFCKQIGFKSISSCDYGNNSRREDIWSLKRIGAEVPIELFAVNILRAFNL